MIVSTCRLFEGVSRLLVPWLMLFLTAGIAGCGGPRRVPVEGIVTLDGKPVMNAAVTFMPTAGGRPGLASTDSDGRFVIREAGMVDGLLPGNYEVVVLKAVFAQVRNPLAPPPGPRGDGEPVQYVEGWVGPETIERYIVPKQYSRPETSGLRATIAGPTKDLIFSLTSKP